MLRMILSQQGQISGYIGNFTIAALQFKIKNADKHWDKIITMPFIKIVNSGAQFVDIPPVIPLKLSVITDN